MTRRPSTPQLVGAATVATSLVIGLGLVFTPSSAPQRPTRAAGSLIVQPVVEPRPATPLPDLEIARSVTIKKAPKPKPEPEPKKEKPAPPPAEASFTISSFNVLGSSHTAGKGGMLPGPVRMRTAASLFNTHGVDIVGLQEMQGDQLNAFQGAAGGTFDVYPGTAAGPLGIENSIAWREAEFSLVSSQTIQIPYFDGRLRPMPYVLLRHNATGRQVWVANFHNPASNPKRGNNDGWRAKAAGIETALAARLSSETGYPVFVTGDMNDREAYFCRLTGGAPMQAANGGSNDGGCNPPPYPMPVDWIFGSESIDFSGYVRDEGPLVRRTSDHPMIRAQVLLDGTDGVPSD